MSWSRLVFVAVAGATTSGCLLPHAGLSKREQGHQAALSRYAASYRPGETRAEVEASLRGNNTPFRLLCRVEQETTAYADLIQIGRNHAGWPFCSGWTIDIAFVFFASGRGKGPISRDPADVLRMVKLEELADACL